MSKFKYRDYKPSNARVIVEYQPDGKKPRVDFSYPIKRSYSKSVRESGYDNISGLFHSIFVKLIGIIIIIFGVILPNKGYFIGGTSALLNSPSAPIFINLGILLLWIMMGYYLFVIGLPMLINFILSLNKETYSRILPKIGVLTSKIRNRIKFKEFKTEDVYKNKVIIPIFNNVILKYDCKEDFADYLKKIEILELPFSYLAGKKKIKNEFFFRAVFYFSKKPKKGNMEVFFD